MPQYDSLKVDNMISIIEQHQEVYKYLPDRIEDQESSQVVVGKCYVYGDQSTFRPVGQIVDRGT